MGNSEFRGSRRRERGSIIGSECGVVVSNNYYNRRMPKWSGRKNKKSVNIVNIII